jgi:hypothetical protein
MTTVTDAAYMAALEKKLMEAERAIYGFRAIFNNYTISFERDEQRRGDLRQGPDGLFAGQLPSPEECED